MSCGNLNVSKSSVPEEGTVAMPERQCSNKMVLSGLGTDKIQGNIMGKYDRILQDHHRYEGESSSISRIRGLFGLMGEPDWKEANGGGSHNGL